MIKNLNDLLSVFILIILTIISFRIFVWSIINKDDKDDNDISRWELIKEYNDNVEE